jgi:hypothetical protein
MDDAIKRLRWEWDAGHVSRLDFATRARALINESNIDEIVAAMPPKVLATFIRCARGWVDMEPGDLVPIGRGEPLREHPATRMALASWLRRVSPGTP